MTPSSKHATSPAQRKARDAEVPPKIDSIGMRCVCARPSHSTGLHICPGRAQAATMEQLVSGGGEEEEGVEPRP